VNVALVMLLALIWGVVLIPSAVRTHRSNLHNSIGGFEKAMTVLAPHPVATRRVLVPSDVRRIMEPATARRLRMLERRRNCLVGLVGATSIAFLGAITIGGLFTRLLIIAGVALAGYVTALRQVEIARQQQERVVALDAARARHQAVDDRVHDGDRLVASR